MVDLLLVLRFNYFLSFTRVISTKEVKESFASPDYLFYGKSRMVKLLYHLIWFAIWEFDFAISYTGKCLWHGFFPRNSIMYIESFEIFFTSKDSFSSPSQQPTKSTKQKSSAYKPSPRHILTGNTKFAIFRNAIWACQGLLSTESNSVF